MTVYEAANRLRRVMRMAGLWRKLSIDIGDLNGRPCILVTCTKDFAHCMPYKQNGWSVLVIVVDFVPTWSSDDQAEYMDIKQELE